MCQTFEGGERQNCGNALFYLQKAIQTADLPYNEGRQTGRRPVCAVCRKSMGGGFLEQIKVRLMEELQTPVASQSRSSGDSGHPVCGGVLAGDGGADPGGGAGDPAIQAPTPQAATVTLWRWRWSSSTASPKTTWGPTDRTSLPIWGPSPYTSCCATSSGSSGWCPHQGSERHGGTGHHERGADLWGTVSVPRAAGRAEKIYGAYASAASHQPDGGGDPAPGPVYAAVRQHPGGVHHHGADQGDGPAGVSLSSRNDYVVLFGGVLEVVVFVFLPLGQK